MEQVSKQYVILWNEMMRLVSLLYCVSWLTYLFPLESFLQNSLMEMERTCDKAPWVTILQLVWFLETNITGIYVNQPEPLKSISRSMDYNHSYCIQVSKPRILILNWGKKRRKSCEIFTRMNVARGLNLFFHRAGTIKERLFSRKYLLYTNVGISISLSATGDILEQHYEILKGEWKCWSQTRTQHMAISGMTVGIICHYWYKFLDARIPGKTIGVVMKKLLLDQLICSPLYIGVFFLTLGILENTSWTDLKTEMREKFHKLYIAEWVIWPPAQIINFYFVPTRFRVLYDNMISLGYDVYTSNVKHGGKDKINE